jgi:DNA-binding transcriptional LysR family regulator
VRLRHASSDWPQADPPTTTDELAVDSYDEALDMVAAGDHVLLTTAACVQRHDRPDVAYIDQPHISPSPIYLVWRAGDAIDLTSVFRQSTLQLLEGRQLR